MQRAYNYAMYIDYEQTIALTEGCLKCSAL